MSRKGLNYRAANGQLIPNSGEKTVPAYNNGNRIEAVWQVAPVTKPLAGIREMVKANNRVVFDDSESYILNKTHGTKVPINEVQGQYEFDMCVHVGKNGNKRGGMKKESTTPVSNMFGVFSEDMDFTRLA